MDFVVLSSSRGTTFQAVINALQGGSLNATCLGLVADREDRECIEKARSANIPIRVVQKEKGEEREEYDKRLQEAIVQLSPDSRPIIAALGWMYIFSPWFVEQWRNRIVNVHPALLPKHPGAHAIEETLKESDTETGMTIHIIDEGVDTGPILVQKKCSVLAHDTEETLKKRVQELEKEWYPKTLQMIEEGDILLPSI